MRGKAKRRAINKKTSEMIHEGYRPDVASAAAHAMDRRGDLGSEGGYRRKTSRPPGPRGKQRRGAS